MRLERRPTESSRKWRLIHRSSGSTRGDTGRGDTCNSKAPGIRSAAPGRVVSQDRKAPGSGIGPDYASNPGPGSGRPFVVRGDFLRRCRAFPLRSARTVEWRSIIGRPAGRRTSSSSGTRAGWSGRSGTAAPFPQIQGRIPRPILTEARMTPDSTVPGARYLPDTYPNRSPNHHYPDSGNDLPGRVSKSRSWPAAARDRAAGSKEVGAGRGPGNGGGGVRPTAAGPVPAVRAAGDECPRREVPGRAAPQPADRPGGAARPGSAAGAVTRPPAARGLSGR